SARALARGPDYPAIEFQKRWYSWDEMRTVAERLNALLDASGVDPHAPIAMVPRNRPQALAAVLGLMTRGRTIRMIHVYQSPAGVARDLGRLSPAAVVIGSEDLADELRAVLRERGIVGVSLAGMNAAAIPGCDTARAAHDPSPARRQIELLTSGTTGPPKQFA